MARPEEKAQAMLNKWVRMRDESDPNSQLSRQLRTRQKRPHLASQCEHLSDALHYRNQIIREITEGVRKIQNAGLGEHAIRDLNDSINKLIREKYHWNRRIKELGGKDYNKEERKAMAQAASQEQGGAGIEGVSLLDDQQQGLSLKGSGGYRYFGAAKDLPGVRELFARHAAKITKRKRGDVYKYITPDYYGLRDEEDGVLLELEHDLAVRGQKKLRECRDEYAKDVERKQQQQQQQEGQKKSTTSQSHELLYGTDESDGDDEDETGIDATVAVPSQEVVAQVLLEKKKEALLSRFA
jgi:pre-mRNA-splicing factor ISY1